MSDRQLNDWLKSYIEFTSNTEPPLLFRTWSGISVIGSLLQRKCRLNLGDFEVFYPNMYIVLVGPPAVGKGTAMRPALEFLQDLGVRLAPDKITLEKLIRVIASPTDSVVDDLNEDGEMVQCNMVIFAPELTVFTSYKSKNEELMTALNDWYDCKDPWIYDTKNAGTDSISGIWVFLFGGTTPDLLREALPSGTGIGGGFTSRVIFVYEEKKDKIVIIPSLSKEQKIIREHLMTDAARLYAMQGQFKYTKEFIEYYTDWRLKNEHTPPFTDKNLEGYAGRRHVHLLKLSMIMSASRGSSMAITGTDFRSALDLLEATEVKMPNIFKGVGANPYAGTLHAIMELIAHKKTVDFSEIFNAYYCDAPPDMLEKMVYSLRKAGFCTIQFSGDENNRKATIKYKPKEKI